MGGALLVGAQHPPAPRLSSLLQVQVELKKGETIMTDASLHLPATFLHEAFSNRSGVPTDHFELYYRGKRLEGEAALASWGVGKDATIEVKMRGRGGGCAGSKEASTDQHSAGEGMLPGPSGRGGRKAPLVYLKGESPSLSKVDAANQLIQKAEERYTMKTVEAVEAASADAAGANAVVEKNLRGAKSGNLRSVPEAETAGIELHGGLALEPAEASLARRPALPATRS